MTRVPISGNVTVAGSRGRVRRPGGRAGDPGRGRGAHRGGGRPRCGTDGRARRPARRSGHRGPARPGGGRCRPGHPGRDRQRSGRAVGGGRRSCPRHRGAGARRCPRGPGRHRAVRPARPHHGGEPPGQPGRLLGDAAGPRLDAGLPARRRRLGRGLRAQPSGRCRHGLPGRGLGRGGPVRRAAGRVRRSRVAAAGLGSAQTRCPRVRGWRRSWPCWPVCSVLASRRAAPPAAVGVETTSRGRAADRRHARRARLDRRSPASIWPRCCPPASRSSSPPSTWTASLSSAPGRGRRSCGATRPTSTNRRTPPTRRSRPEAASRYRSPAGDDRWDVLRVRPRRELDELDVRHARRGRRDPVVRDRQRRRLRAPAIHDHADARSRRPEDGVRGDRVARAADTRRGGRRLRQHAHRELGRPGSGDRPALRPAGREQRPTAGRARRATSSTSPGWSRARTYTGEKELLDLGAEVQSLIESQPDLTPDHELAGGRGAGPGRGRLQAGDRAGR